MKKIVLLCILLLFMNTYVGCDKKMKPFKNYFKDVKSIELSYQGTITEKEKIKEVENIINQLQFSDTEKNMKDIDGNYFLVLVYDDETEKTISFTSELMSDGDNTYSVNQNICDKIKAIFDIK